MNVLRIITNAEGVLIAECDAPRWRQGDELILHLKKRFRAKILRKAEGPDARTWFLRISDKDFTVYQWDTGDNSFVLRNGNDKELLTEIARSVQDELN